MPKASQHKKGEDEYSSTWGGIGGGCLETSCTVTDQTLIQAGTEQDVVSGKPQYSAWWKLIPARPLAIPFDCAPMRTATVWAPGGPTVRFHIGLEDVDDLIGDLERGFAALAAAG